MSLNRPLTDFGFSFMTQPIFELSCIYCIVCCMYDVLVLVMNCCFILTFVCDGGISESSYKYPVSHRYNRVLKT